MDVRIRPGTASGIVLPPPSKSVAHRALIAAALAPGVSKISKAGSSQDVRATLAALQTLGAKVKRQEEQTIVTGCDLHAWQGGEVFCGESGSTLRFLLPLFALMPVKTTFRGAGRLMQRPQTVYKDLFKQMGLPFLQTETEIAVTGPLKAGEYTLAGDISSQFFTGLVFAFSQLAEDSVLHITQPFESEGYLRLTLKVLKEFGVEAILNEGKLFIAGGQKFHAADLTVEADFSSAAFFAVLGALCGSITCTGLDKNTAQSDGVIFEMLSRLGAQTSFDEETKNYVVSGNGLAGGELDIADCPDLGPVLMTAGCFCENGLRLKNTARLRYKESDRAAAMQQELSKLGFLCETQENEIWLPGARTLQLCREYELDSHNDHRIAMALAVAAARLDTPVVIKNAGCVEKSYPDFFTHLQQTGISVEVLL